MSKMKGRLWPQSEGGATPGDILPEEAIPAEEGQETSPQIFQHNERVAHREVSSPGPGDQVGTHTLVLHVFLTPLPKDKDTGEVVMLRERLDVHGMARPMEPRHEIPALQIPPDQIGQIKEAPAMRWLRGQEEWDKRYRKRAKRILKKRKALVKKAERIVKNALEQGLVHEAFPESLVKNPVEKGTGRVVKRKTSIGEIQNDRRWGPLDLKDEKPPPSAIAARRDTVCSQYHHLVSSQIAEDILLGRGASAVEKEHIPHGAYHAQDGAAAEGIRRASCESRSARQS